MTVPAIASFLLAAPRRCLIQSSIKVQFQCFEFWHQALLLPSLVNSTREFLALRFCALRTLERSGGLGSMKRWIQCSPYQKLVLLPNLVSVRMIADGPEEWEKGFCVSYCYD